jgi:serine/threonine protein kinase
MSRLSWQRWAVVSPHLDRALDASPAERASWIASLRATDPTLAADLEALLEEHRAAAAEGFLEGPGPGLGGAIAGGPPVAAVGPYTLISHIGQGGMGSVWLARRNDGRFEGRVAVKLLNVLLMGRAGEERFYREGRILARLAHPNIAHLIDSGVTPAGQPYLILEHVEGQHVDQHCEKSGVDLAGRIQLFLDVLAAVAHAHGNLVVHRDIKPSNVLVGPAGHVKLLDFGIAKLLEGDAEQGATTLTREGGGPLTPHYAAPEQVTGGAITTATDIYALGVLLYQLLTSQHPVSRTASSPAELVKAIVEMVPPTMSQVVRDARSRRSLRGDLDTIVAKALKKAPAERYASVTAFADDLRRYLRHLPISARPEALSYRATRFARRNWLPVSAIVLTVTGLSGGLYVANRERTIAQRRFVEVRKLANTLFDIDVQVRQWPGSSKTRQLIVNTSLEFLQRLAVDVGDDPGLALEVGTAYLRAARVQGVPISANLGQLDQASRTLDRAQQAIDSVLRARPSDRTALLRVAQIAHDRMLLAGQGGRPDEAFLLGQHCRQVLERYLSSGEIESSEAEQVAIVSMDVARRYLQADRNDDAIRLGRRAVELAAASGPLQVGAAQMVVAEALRANGDLEAALEVARASAKALEPPPGERAVGRSRNFALALVRQAQILADDTGPNLGRAADAIALLGRAFTMVEELARQDANESSSRSMVATSGLRLGRLLWPADPPRALTLYETVLARLAEDKNNTRARRDEIAALVGMSYPLRRLGRPDEARQRLGTAFERLRVTGLYPGKPVELGSVVDDALGARADDEAARGQLDKAIDTDEKRLEEVLATNPRPEQILVDASRLSRLYSSLAGRYRRAANADRAAALEARRLALWQLWERRLPGNLYVRGQLSERGPIDAGGR